ncbi:MAG: M48 family metalloprotease [Acidimicrobiales bacterium]
MLSTPDDERVERILRADEKPLPLTPPLPTVRLLASAALLPALVAGLVAGFAGGPIAGPVVFVAVASAVVAWVWHRSARPAAIGLAGRRADPRRDARLVNIVEALCASAGIRMPDLRVVDAEGLNLAAGGRDPARAALVATSGLVDRLGRVELEGILACGVMAIRRGAVVGPSIAAVTGISVNVAVGAGRDILIDGAAVRLTRYPPGLRSALDGLAQRGTRVPGVPRRAAHLWLADPLPGAHLPPYRRLLPERIDALSEL